MEKNKIKKHENVKVKPITVGYGLVVTVKIRDVNEPGQVYTRAEVRGSGMSQAKNGMGIFCPS